MRMSLWAGGLAVLLGLAAGSIRGGEKAGGKDNTPPPGFKALFNGKDLTGWQGVVTMKQRKELPPEKLKELQDKQNAKVLPHWKVEDGVLHYDGKGDSLQSVKDFGNFELYVDWKILPKGDSGIYLRGNPQVQIWEETDKIANKDGKFIGSGGLYNNQKHPSGPLTVADNPAGQ